MDFGEDVLGAWEECRACVSWDDAAGDAVEELGTDGVFELFDVLAERGLAEADAGGGGADRACFGGRDEGSELVEVESGVLIHWYFL